MSDTLFVPEEEETERIKVEDENIELTETKIDEDIVDDLDNQADVVREIPIYLNKTSNLNLFQYITQTSNKQLKQSKGVVIPGARIKPGSNIVEVDVPLNEDKFYDADKAEQWDHLRNETLSGTLMDFQGNYVLRSTAEGDIVLSNVDKLCQLRPVFHHIDEYNDKQIDTSSAGKEVGGSSGIQIVQMSAKSGGSENEVRYSSAIQTFKRSQVEEFENLNWVDASEAQSKKYLESLSTVNDKQDVEVGEYLLF